MTLLYTDKRAECPKIRYVFSIIAKRAQNDQVSIINNTNIQAM
jgi:hypothetical protein